MDIREAIKKCIAQESLSQAEMQDVMHDIMTGAVTPAQIAGFLVALRMKGGTVDEIAAAAKVMRDLALPVSIEGIPNTVDIVGTGGDASGTFNVSTTCAFVAAAAGCYVAKHGNRSVSSKSGAADVLEAYGVELNLTPEQVELCIRETGVGFIYAPGFHSAMRYAAGPRREIGIRTIFNVLGPLTNPARVTHQLIGVYSADLLEPIAEVLKLLGSRHALIVNSEDGLDEISISAPTYVAELNNGEITRYVIKPEDFGISRAPLSSIQVANPEESRLMIEAVLKGQPGPAADVVRLNAGACLFVAGIAASVNDGIEQATEILRIGSAYTRLEHLVSLSSSFAA